LKLQPLNIFKLIRDGSLTGLFRPAAWSLLGNLLPMIAAVAAVPFLMHQLGQERLGVLTLIWVVIGYFSFLDMGLGRAVTVAVASWRHQPERETAELHVLGTASVLLLATGSLAAILLVFSITAWGLPVKLSSTIFALEVELALVWMVPSLPLLLLSSVLRGHLEGVGAFRALNLVRIPTGILLMVGPCVTSVFSPDLVFASFIICAVRLLQVLALMWLVAGEMQRSVTGLALQLLRSARFGWLKRLLVFGGWATVSNVVGPVIVYVDRFVIGMVMAATAVTAYAVPFDVVSRLPLLIAAFCSVLLPELARLSRGSGLKPGSAHAVHRLVNRSSWLSVWVVIAIVGVAYLATPLALRLWLGSSFAAQSSELTRILLVAFGINAMAQIPFTALQAAGRVRPVALLHLAELLPYAAVLYVSVSAFGLVGAAYVCLARSVIDYAALALMWRSHVVKQIAGFSG
jgi:O-antigen/teichoic acid export membrane protein